LPAKVGDIVLPSSDNEKKAIAEATAILATAPVVQKGDRQTIQSVKDSIAAIGGISKEVPSKVTEAAAITSTSTPSKEQPTILKDPVKAMNALVMKDERIGVSTDEAEIAFAYVLARKNLRIQQESLLVAEKLVEELRKKVEEAQAEVSNIHSKLEAL
jgi:valyl-tRNA synthetase